MPHEGFISLWRKSLGSRIFQNEGLWKVWTWCLLKASYTKRWVSLKTGRNMIEVEINKGQFLFGKYSAAKQLNMNPSTVYKRIQKLKKLQNLTLESNHQYTLITIVNWDAYQGDDKNSNRKSNHRVTTECPPSNTNNKVNKVKEGNNNKTFMSDSIEIRLASYLSKHILRNNPKYKKPDLQKWAKTIDLMIRIDKRLPDDIELIIRWCQNDTPDKQSEGKWKGWASNILSANSLREKFDKLYIKMQEAKPQESKKQYVDWN